MKILGIETSCDETAAAVVEDGNKILSHVVSSSISLYQETGGIIPEVAAREQLRFLIPVVDEALKRASLSGAGLDALAVTAGPGLINSLLVGVETAKALAWAWQKSLVPVNHLLGHFYVNFVDWLVSDVLEPACAGRLTNHQSAHRRIIPFPLIYLVVSGGHTHLFLAKGHHHFSLLGQTRDDAAGEAFDKVARLLGLGFPGGPEIEKASGRGDSATYPLPRPMLNDRSLDFSFSGLKTAVLRETLKGDFSSVGVADLAASFQAAVVEVLTVKTEKALRLTGVKSLVAGGGVLANQALRRSLTNLCRKLSVNFFAPPKKLSTDNAVGIAAAAFYHFSPKPLGQIRADTNLVITPIL